MSMIGDQKFTNNQINIIRGLIRVEFKQMLEEYYEEHEQAAAEDRENQKGYNGEAPPAVDPPAPAPEKAVDTAANAGDVEAEKVDEVDTDSPLAEVVAPEVVDSPAVYSADNQEPEIVD